MIDRPPDPRPPAGQSPQIDPRAALAALWRRKFVLVPIIVLIPLVVYLLVHRDARVYQSSAVLDVQAEQLQAVGLTSAITPATVDPTTLNALARLITTPDQAAQAAALLTPRPDPASLLGHVSASVDPNTGFITITTTGATPQRAADVANAFTQTVVAGRAQSAAAELRASLADLKAQLAALPRNDPDRIALKEQIAQLQALRDAESDSTQVVQSATADPTPISPRPLRSALLALIVAILLALGLVIVLETIDRRIREPEDLERVTALPLLSAIPSRAFTPSELPAADHEAFYMLRASLTYFNVDRRISSVLISSALPGDGKTTVCTNLALAMARAGKDVILLDADLRRSTAAARLHASPRGGGLADVIVGESSLDDALVLCQAPGASTGRLRLLAAGPHAPNPSELIASQRMLDVLRELTERCDIVLVDSAPLLTVSDSIPLLGAVSGVVLVARMGQTTRDSFGRLEQVVRSAGGTPLGTVATDTQSGVLYGRYRYGAYPAADASSNGRAGHPSLRRRAGRRRAARPAPTPGPTAGDPPAGNPLVVD